MPRRHLDYFSPTADGPLLAKVNEHDDALDAAEAAIAGIEEDLSETPEGLEPSDAAPQAIGTATAGVSANYSRADHVHALPADHVTDAMLRESAALSVIGRAANSIGNPADIPAGGNLQYFGRRANALGFFSLTEDDLGRVIDRQTLAGTPTSITIPIDGDLHQRIIIDGSGDMDDTVGDDVTVEINNVALNGSGDGTATTGAGYVSMNTISRTPADQGVWNFRIIADVRRTGGHNIAVVRFEAWGYRIDITSEFHYECAGAVALAANATTFEIITSGRKFANGYLVTTYAARLAA